VVLAVVILIAAIVGVLLWEGEAARQSRRTEVEFDSKHDSGTRPPEPSAAKPETEAGESTGATAVSAWWPLGRANYGIAGRVVDRAGEPIEGAKIEYQQDGVAWFGLHGDWRQRGHRHPEPTDAQGRFVIAGLERLEWSLAVYCDGYDSARVTVTGGDQSVVVTLLRGARMSGRVVFAGGEPAPGAEVLGAVADSDGRFTVSNVDALVRSLSAKLGDFWGTTTVEAADGQHLNGLRIVLERAVESIVPLVIVGPDGTPFANREIQLEIHPEGEYGSRYRATTDARGGWRTKVRMPPGMRVRIRIERDWDQHLVGWQRTAHTRPLDARGDIEWRLGAPCRVTFEVPHIPDPDVSVEHGYELERAGGRFVFAVTPDFPTTFRIYATGFLPEAETWRARDGETRTIRMVREASATGRVLLADGRIARSARVNWGGVNSKGRFWEWQLEEGDAELEVRARRGFLEVAVARLRVAVRAGETTDVGDIVLPPEGTLVGVVRDAAGRPMGGVQMMAVARDFGVAGHMITGVDGRFSIPVFGGPFRVVAWKRGTGTAISAPTKPGRPIPLRLAPETRIRLVSQREVADFRISTADGYPLVHAWGDEDADLLRALPACPLRFAIVFDDGSRIEREVKPEAGRLTEVRTR